MSCGICIGGGDCDGSPEFQETSTPACGGRGSVAA